MILRFRQSKQVSAGFRQCRHKSDQASYTSTPDSGSPVSRPQNRSRPARVARTKPVVRFGGAREWESRLKQTVDSFHGIRRETAPGDLSTTMSLGPTSSQSDIFSRKKWNDLGLSENMISALTELQLTTPTIIQEITVPALAKEPVNAIIADQTGTGKTLAYLIPIMEYLKRDEAQNGISAELHRPRGLVLAPSRELAEQIGQVAKFLARIVKLRVVVLVGGMKFKPEKDALSRQPVDLIVTTTGRLLKHREQDRLYISKLKYVAVDEADTMLAKDFKDDLIRIVDPIRRGLNEGNRRTGFVFAAATLSKLLLEEVEDLFPNTIRLVTPSVHKVAGTVRQEFIRCDADKPQVLLRLLRQMPGSAKTMVFCNTLDSCRFVDKFLRENAMDVALVHGAVPPRLRKTEFRNFMAGEVNILVCSDVAARGLDTTDVNHVILFDFPHNVVDYIHRVGRTARAGRSGVAYSLVRKREVQLSETIQQSIRAGASLDGVGRSSNDGLVS